MERIRGIADANERVSNRGRRGVRRSREAKRCLDGQGRGDGASKQAIGYGTVASQSGRAYFYRCGERACRRMADQAAVVGGKYKEQK